MIARSQNLHRAAKVLVIDDNAVGCDLMAQLLRRSGQSAECAYSAGQALQMLSSSLPDVLLLDVKMPGMDGLEFLENIQSYVRFARLKVILVTGEDRDAIASRAGALGVAHIFLKGAFQFSALLESIDALLGEN